METIRVQLPDPEVQPTMTVQAAAAALRIGQVQAYRAVASGELPAFRIGRSWRVPTAELRRMLGLDERTDDAA